jgi:hypothetical protein
MPQVDFLVSLNTLFGAMTMYHNGINVSPLSSNDLMLGAKSIAPATHARLATTPRPLGFGILAAFVRSRELRRRIKFAAQAQSARLC